MEFLRANVSQQPSIVIKSPIDTSDINIFSLARRNLEVNRFERPDFRNKSQEECEHLSAKTRLAVSFPPLSLVAGAGKIVSKLSRIEVWSFRNERLFPRNERYSRHFRNDMADCAAKCADRQVFVRQDIAQRHAIRILKRSFQNRFRNFESDEIVVAIRSVSILCDLRHVETKFRANMRLRIVFVGHMRSIFLAQLWEEKGDRFVDRRMPHISCRIVCKGAESE